VIKLLAVAERLPTGVSVRVHPTLIRASHPLAGVHGSFNAVFVEAENAGELMFYGRGAGGAPTASAVLGDIVSAARHRVLGGKGPQESSYAQVPVLAPWEGVNTRLQIRMLVDDKLGVLAQIAAILGQNGISIDAVHQPAGDGPDERAELVIASYSAPASGLDTALAQIEELDVVRAIVSVLRVEGA
jgi:homoserine dehydrogenase